MTLAQYVTAIVAVVALVLSAASFTLSVLTYRRDRSKVRAWSMIEWRNTGPETMTPTLRIRILNAGRRPIALMSLVMKSGTHLWFRTLMDPRIPMNDVVEAMRELERSQLAHVAVIKLAEGEVFEIAFQVEDCDEFLATHLDGNEYEVAETLLVEDAMGSRYPVRDSEKHLEEMMAAWNAARARVAAAKDARAGSKGETA
jgi:hypothetical protein